MANIPIYKFRKFTPRVAPVIALNSPCVTEWEFPADEVYNLSRSFVEADFLLAAAGAERLTCWHSGFIASIATIELLTTGGLKLASLDNLPQNTKLTLRPTTAQSEFLDYPIHPPAVNAAESIAQYAGSFHRSNAKYWPGDIDLGSNLAIVSMLPNYTITTASLAAAPLGYTFDQVYQPNDTHVISGAVMPTSTAGIIAQRVAAFESFTGVSSCIPSAALSQLKINFSLPLHFLSGSLFSVDQDLYFGQKLVLRVVWNNGALMGYNVRQTDGDNVTALTTAPVISNACVMLAMQANRSLQDVHKAKFAAGIKLNIPYTTSYRKVQSNGGAALQQMTFNQKINSSFGHRLLRIYSAVFNNGGEAGGPYYCQNQNFFQTFYTRISSQWDGQNLQETAYDETRGDLYRAQRHRLARSVCGSTQQFLSSPFLLDDWTPWQTIESKAHDVEDCGVSLPSYQINYDITASVSQAGADNNTLFMSFIITQKKLNISPDGITCQ